MIPQFSEGIPFIRVDEKRETIWLKRDQSNALSSFYENYSEDLKLSISEAYARGFYTFISALKGRHLSVFE